MNGITHYSTLAEALLARAQADPRGRACVFLSDDGSEEAVDNGRLYGDASRIALGLADRGGGTGEAVILALDHGYELVTCFWGATSCGVVPSIAAYPPRLPDAAAYARRIARMAGTVRAQAVITMPDLRSSLAEALGGSGCRVFTPGELAGDRPGPSVTLTGPKEGQAAFIQFTSGTTASPKAILFSHRAVLDHIAASVEAYGMTRDWVYVSWLPFYHDMGLVGHIRSLLYGDLFVSMSPQAWLRRPALLLQSVSRYRGTLTNMPNFGFDYCTRRVGDDELAGVDLSSWRVLTNGAEPVLTASMERFHKRFSRFGLRDNVFAVGYGMAENICGISLTPPGQGLGVDWISAVELHEGRRAVPVEAGSAGSRAVTGCGFPYRGIELAIMDDDGAVLPERSVGEIAVRSNTLFTGYHLDPGGAAASFRDGWFLTGDLGYMAGRQLYVCDRKKDLIIAGGSNVHPVAVEGIAAGIFGEYASRCAAFGIHDQDLGTEVPVLVIERRRELGEAAERELAGSVRRVVLDELDVALADVRVVPRGWLVKTTSGKLARGATREKYLGESRGGMQAEPGPPAAAMSREGIEKEVARLFETALGVSGVGPGDDFIRLGGDSLSALRLFTGIERRFGRRPPAEEFFRRPTVAHLAEVLSRPPDAAGDAPGPAGGEPTEEAPPRAEEGLRELSLADMPSPGFAYGARLDFLAWLYGKRWAQRIFGGSTARLARSFHALITGPGQGETEAVRSAMITRSPGGIQAQLVSRLPSGGPSSWKLDADTAALERAYAEGRGVILAGRHASLSLVIREIALERLRPAGYYFVKMAAGYLTDEARELLPRPELRRMRLSVFLGQLMAARRVLSDGGVVFFLPDARDGLSRGIPVPMHGRILNFKTGFAEMSLETGAPVVPVSLSLDVPARKVSVRFLEPMDSGTPDVPRDGRIEGLVRQYAAYLAEEWRRCPGSVHAKQMKAFCSAPPAE